MFIIKGYFIIALISMTIGIFGAADTKAPWWGRAYYFSMFVVGLAVAVILYEKCRMGC